MEGIVIKSTGSWYVVKYGEEKIDCKIKGKLRIKGIKTTNPVAVGDRVDFEILQKENIGVIRKINQRNNYIIRKATKLSKVSHIIASNIDQAFLIVTLAYPRTSTGFIDRFLVTAEAYNIPVIIVFNKIDIYNDEIKKRQEELVEIYSKIGYKNISVSALRGDNIDLLKSLIKDKINLFSGHSGVGKSTLINVIQPGLNLRTSYISKQHNKGRQTTTNAEMLELSFGGYIIDSPGIKEFGLIDFKKDEVPHYFPEMRALMNDCKFNNCTHTHEPECAVKKAVENGDISTSRYNNYLSILNDEYFEEKEWEKK
ncbi:MAG: ribosome small subunit-dependent GTPase A [Bacteroidales bacterium]|nr:ribosome small subunit-dependent GTPase A [Bacteroidales bacterium]